MKSESSYRPMAQDSLEDLSLLKPDSEHTTRAGEDCPISSACHRKARHLKIILAFCALLNVILLWAGLAFYANRGPKNPIFPQSLYSPVQHLIDYETKVFHEGFGSDRSLYQMDPSPEVDAAWEGLYQFGVSRITKEEASHLVNHTYRLPGDEDHYVVQLDVFHQLHCLNMLRKAVNPHYYTDSQHTDSQHWGHCIESIRQSLMCSVDVTPLVWQWVERLQGVRIHGNIIHTCRKFDTIMDWAVDHRLGHVLNFTGFH